MQQDFCVFINCYTHSPQHDANNEPSEGPDTDERRGAPVGNLGQSPHRTQENSQEARLQQLTLPTCTNNQKIINELLYLTQAQCVIAQKS